MRTTLDIQRSVLDELTALKKKEGKTLGEIATELFLEALAQRRKRREKPAGLVWRARAMKAKVDLRDKELVQQLLDGPARR